ncbi:MAG: hypothetical protein WCF36_10165 [Candidatus Nanopelagicales bacterium]
MDVEQAQADVRGVYRGGFSGPLISSLIWFVAAAVYEWDSQDLGMLVLFFGGMLIFPLSTLALKLLGGPAALPRGHPSVSLAMQAAFTVPLGLLVALALGSYEPARFFPAALVIVGAHYLVFISLYGMRLYAVLAAVLIAVGSLGLFGDPSLGDMSGWIGGAVLLLFTVPLYLAGHAPVAGSPPHDPP